MLHLMAMYNIPGAVLALIKDHRIVLAKGYGYRDPTARAPVTITSLFNVGSISKSFAALGIAQLVDLHLIDLDAPVIRYPRVWAERSAGDADGDVAAVVVSYQWPSRGRAMATTCAADPRGDRR